MSTITAPQVNKKPLKIIATRTWSEDQGLESSKHIKNTLDVLQSYPVDMISFEPVENGHQIRSVGYHLVTEELDEKTILHTSNESIERKFWFKLDDYGDYYVGTFLYPEEY